MCVDEEIKNERTCQSLPGQPRLAKVQRKWGNLWGKWQGVAMGVGVSIDKEMRYLILSGKHRAGFDQSQISDWPDH